MRIALGTVFCSPNHRFARACGLVATTIAALAGCGGQTSATVGDQQITGDAGTDAAAAPGDASTQPVDAGIDVDTTCESQYPAQHYPIPTMKNFGGPVLASPHIVTVTFKGNGNRDAIRKFDDLIVQGAWWKSVTDGFNIGPGTGGTYAELDDTVSGKSLDDSKDLAPMIQSWVQNGQLPAPDANTLYAMYFPQSTTITLEGTQSCQGFGGYHNSTTTLLPDGGVVNAAYAVMPDCGFGLDTVTTSHEFIEAATDPHPLSGPTYYMFDDAWAMAGGGEVADVCETRGSVSEQGFDVTKSWVNKAALASKDPCEPEDPNEIFFGAAVPTEIVHNIPDPTGGPAYDSGGYVVMKKGQNKTLDVVVFSEAALPNELKLAVGRRRRGSGDPADLGPIGTGITATLSSPTGHNCQHVTLTIALDANVASGSYPFVTRAILNDNDYHSWPAILKVQ